MIDNTYNDRAEGRFFACAFIGMLAFYLCLLAVYIRSLSCDFL